MTRRVHAHHAVEQEVGGRTKRSPNLRVLQELSLPEDWEMRSGTPATLADCPTVRPCPHIKCRMHLWLTESEARPGRRHAQDVGGVPESSIQPHTPASCAMDVARDPRGRDSKNQLTYAEVGAYFGITDERARVIAEQALAKLKALGYTLDDLLSPESR
jgi:hypothetical protein